MKTDFSLKEFQQMDPVLYEVIASIIHASIEPTSLELKMIHSKFTEKQFIELVAFMTEKIVNNKGLMLKEYELYKLLFLYPEAYFDILKMLIEISCVEYNRGLSRTRDKHVFFTFLNWFDKKTKEMKVIDNEIYVDINKINNKTKQGVLTVLCVKYYDKIKEIFDKYEMWTI